MATSRTADRAQQFGSTFGIVGQPASYEVLAADLDFDIVYMATALPAS